MDCPIKQGPQDLYFGFNRIPAVFNAGKYELEVRVADTLGRPVMCVKGTLEVPLGPQGQIFRRLQYYNYYTTTRPWSWYYTSTRYNYYNYYTTRNPYYYYTTPSPWSYRPIISRAPARGCHIV